MFLAGCESGRLSESIQAGPKRGRQHATPTAQGSSVPTRSSSIIFLSLSTTFSLRDSPSVPSLPFCLTGGPVEVDGRTVGTSFLL